jgi:hypothetical protein
MGNDHPKDSNPKSGLKSPRGEQSRETLGYKKRTSFDIEDQFVLNEEEGLPADIIQTYAAYTSCSECC